MPCSGPNGTFDQATGCYMRIESPQPPYNPTLWQGHPKGQGSIYLAVCGTAPQRTGKGVTWSPPKPVWRAGPPKGPTITPGQLAKQAFASMSIPGPKVPTSPAGVYLDGVPYTTVQGTTWYWTDPSIWHNLSVKAQAGAVWAQVTVKPQNLRLDPGDGLRASLCAGPGTPWTSSVGSYQHAPGGCDVRYTQAAQTNTATMGIVWHATWVGSGGTHGDLGTVTTSSPWTFEIVQGEALLQSSG
ncbi:hypothetical protein [Leekyejoonella antrihumi]|uniref:ATP/GTP-binding protein n=1 Tax=Leekyejoonella antrihumi TaxID=1660198 RepID=A0A563DWY6_9MICO|nr:hypothetical protein [Leekyejoonella antrihumi]TWP34452.1 hypothetical protein FGL98_17195 [Leekyejoonella antrihumi]